MNLLQLLKKYFGRISLRDGCYGPPSEIQRAFLEQLPSPRDDWDRSYLQYLCQKFLLSRIWSVLVNCAAAFLLPIYWWSLRDRKLVSSQPCGAVLLFSGSSNIAPHSLYKEYDIIQIKDFQNHLRLDREDRAYLRVLRRRYPFAFYFRFKCMIKIAMYSDTIARYKPKAIICSEEYSFTSSLLTDYCRTHFVKHINFQHGAKWYFIREAFFHFDQCYVWDQHSANLMSDLLAEPNQFIVELPPSLSLSGETTTLERVDYTYYLQVPTHQELNTIINNLKTLRKQGAKIAIRPHPLYIDMVSSLYQDPAGFLLENPLDIPIEQSLLRTNCAIALSSAVLIQASYNDIPIVMDDVTVPGLYEDLKERQYICSQRTHRRLSALLNAEE